MNFDAFYIISQAFALAATILSLYAFQRRKKIQILNYTVVAEAIFIVNDVAAIKRYGEKSERGQVTRRYGEKHKSSQMAYVHKKRKSKKRHK